MLGSKIAEGKGKRIVRRILSTEPPTAEVTFESNGTIAGVASAETGTYTSVIRPDGSIYGEGHGLVISADGDTITWRGSGLGKFGAGGSVSYRGMIFYQSGTQKFASLSNTCGAFEFEVDGAGNTSGQIWEWK